MDNKVLKLIVGTFVMLCTGLMYAWSVLSMPIRSEIPTLTQGNVSSVFTLAMACFCLGGLVAGILKTNGLGRISILIAAILLPAGYFLASYAESASFLFLGYGLMVGLGTGIVYTYILSNLTVLFPGSQGLISGILLFGFGMSSMVVGPLYTNFVENNSFRTFFRGFGIFAFIVILLASVLIKDIVRSRDESSDDSSSTPMSMLKSKVFWIYVTWALIFTAIGLVVISQSAVIISTSIPGVSMDRIAILVGLLSISNGFGRIIAGQIFDSFGYSRSMYFIVAMALGSLSLILINLKLGSNFIMVLAFIMVGLFYGGIPSTNSAIALSLFGEKYYSINLSYMNLNILVASFAATAAGIIYDRSGSYSPTLIISIGLTIVGFIMVFIAKSIIENRPKTIMKSRPSES